MNHDLLSAHIQAQGSADLRAAQMPDPPWPAAHDVLLGLLLAQAREQLAQGETVEQVMLWLATHAWFEGGIAALVRVRLGVTHDDD